jgi:hypothetical protein
LLESFCPRGATGTLSSLPRLREMGDARRAFVARFQGYNIEGRYPEHMPAAPSRMEAEEGLTECKETIAWLESLST